MNNAIEPLMRAMVQAPSGDNTQALAFRRGQPAQSGSIASWTSRGMFLPWVWASGCPASPSARAPGKPPGGRGTLRMDGASGCPLRRWAWWWLPGRTRFPKSFLGSCLRRSFSESTNRRPYDGRPVAEEILDELRRQTPELAGVTTHWITGRERIAAWAEVISEADARMFGEPSPCVPLFSSKVCFDAPVKAEVDQGLCLASLEVSAPRYCGAVFDANHAGLAAEAGRGPSGSSRRLPASWSRTRRACVW